MLGAVGLASCTTSTLPQKDAPTEAQQHGRSKKTNVVHTTGNDAPEISRSVGEEGGVIVLWPRVVPKSDDPAVQELAAAVQARLSSTAKQIADNVDTRPEPERVCPKGNGCKAVSLGAVVTVKGGGCSVVALVGPPGVSSTRLVPWIGGVELRATTVPFREPPENQITVAEFAPCDKVRQDIASNAPPGDETKLTAAIKEALGK